MKAGFNGTYENQSCLSGTSDISSNNERPFRYNRVDLASGLKCPSLNVIWKGSLGYCTIRKKIKNSKSHKYRSKLKEAIRCLSGRKLSASDTPSDLIQLHTQGYCPTTQLPYLPFLPQLSPAHKPMRYSAHAGLHRSVDFVDVVKLRCRYYQITGAPKGLFRHSRRAVSES